MIAKDRQTMKALLTKLSAVRMTLSDEEQVLLDGLVLARRDEVIAHRMAQAVDPKAVPDADEVVAHRMAQAVDPKAVPDADEVVAHRMAPAVDPKAVPDADEVIAHRFEIVFDPEMEAYQLKP